MPAPTDSTTAGRLYRRWLPVRGGDPDAGYPLGALAEALAAPLEPVNLVVRESDTHPAWAPGWDAETAPLWILPWIAENVGVEWHGAATETLRTILLDLPNFKGGRQDAQIAAAKLTLTGGKHVTVTEPYHGDWWQQLYVTFAAETPNVDATRRGILSRKAAGKVLTYRTDPGWSVGHFEAAYAALTVANAESTFSSVGTFEATLPTP